MTMSNAALFETLVQRVRTLEKGDVAKLRRMSPEAPGDVFYKVAKGVLNVTLTGKALHRDELRWATIAKCLALVGEYQSKSSKLGKALNRAKFSERRFSYLLSTENVAVLSQRLPACARLCKRAGVYADWYDALRMFDREGHARQDIARSFYE